jgi:Zn-dependent peptidase ImmA (M78 family)/transcriptional regulator with XRE-family HTH domain
MKLGTPGFDGHRLRKAREARGLSASSLADLLGVTRSAVSQYELSIQTPRSEIVERACRALNLPAAYLLSADEGEQFETVFYRSMGADTKTSRIRAVRRLEWLNSVTQYLKAFVEMPIGTLPVLGFPRNPRKITNQDVEQAAIGTRNAWGISDAPITNLVRTAENNGVVVGQDEFASDALTAVSAWHGRDAYILMALNLVAVFTRYELARQIGHLVLHRGVHQQQLATNVDFAILRDQASRFAAALLLPEGPFCNDLYAFSLDAMRIAKQKWRAPISIMILRLQNLGLISDEEAKRLWISKSRRRWKDGDEPLDDELAPEKPRLLSESVNLLVEEQVLSKAEILAGLPYSDRDIELLAGLPQGYLTDTMPVVTIVAPRQRRLELSGGESAPIIDFPQNPTGIPKGNKLRRG